MAFLIFINTYLSGCMRRLFTQISHYYVLAIAFMLGLMVFLPDSGYDKYFWVTWAQYIKEHGLTQAYNNPEINYHPVILFIIKGFTLFIDNPNYTNINWLKVPTALFDWGIIFLSLKLMQYHKVNLQWGLLLAFNPAFWYNTVIWGQFDSIWVFFILLAFYLADRKYFFYSVAAFVLALNTKLFALFFLPFLVLMWIKLKPDTSYEARKFKFSFWPEWRTVAGLKAIVIKILSLQVLLLLPFISTTHYSIPSIIERSTEYYNSLSRNAYNIWYYFFENPLTTGDANYLWPAAIGVTIAFLVLLFLQYKQKITIWQSAALASLIFFLFLTRMHERYAHAAMVFSFIAFLSSPLIKGVDSAKQKTGDLMRELLPFIFISLAYLLNLEAVMQMLNKSLGFSVDYNSILFNPKLIATLYVISLVLLVISTFTAQKNHQERA